MIIQTGGGACGSFRVSTHAPFRHDGNRFHRHFLWIFHTEFIGIVDFREGEGGREGGCGTRDSGYSGVSCVSSY